MPQYNQVTGSNSQLALYRETAFKKPDASSGVLLAISQENFADGVNKQQSAIIRGQRGPGKPFRGFLQLTGGVTVAADAVQLGHLFRALCGAPQSKEIVSVPILASAPVVDLGDGCVGFSAAGHGFRQDAVITVVGTMNYDGTYRVDAQTTADMLAVRAPFVAESPDDGTVYRGRAARLVSVREGASGTVRFATDGHHRFSVGDKITLDGTTGYDDEHTVSAIPDSKTFEIAAAYTAETLTDAVAVPAFFQHIFRLPKVQNTVCFEKTFGFDAGAAATPNRRYLGCKINGFDCSIGGDSQLLPSLEVLPADILPSDVPLNLSPKVLSQVPLENIEASIYIDGKRRGDVETANFSAKFGIEQKNAIGDMGAFSRLPEGDPQISISLSVFLESDELQRLVDANATVHTAVVLHGDCGDELHIVTPETELSSSGPAISGKGGIMQALTVMAFVESSPSILEFVLVNRVASYA